MRSRLLAIMHWLAASNSKVGCKLFSRSTRSLRHVLTFDISLHFGVVVGRGGVQKPSLGGLFAFPYRPVMVEYTAEQLPEYDNPPVVEVVCGVLFKPIEGLTIPYFGMLWDRFKPEYRRSRQMPPLASVTERFDGSPSEAELNIALPRVWFATEDESGLIQVQGDRFHHNWKQSENSKIYPHYESVFDKFLAHLDSFEAFLDEQQLGTVEARQYEMTYVNHIPAGTIWKSSEEIGKIFPDFGWRIAAGRFLPAFEAISWTTIFPLPEQTGRLHIGIRLGRRNPGNIPVIRLDLTARGIGKDSSRDGMIEWFNVAHRWIVWGFTDLTSEDAHKQWKRKI